MQPSRDATPRDLLPLRPAVFALLVVLEAGPRHGYSLMKRVGEHLGGATLGPGTLYRLLKELREGGLIEAVDAPRDEGDARRQYHGLTPLGRDVARLEAERVAGLLSQAGLAALLSRDRG